MHERRVRTLTGTVVSDKMTKTVILLVQRRVPHPLYRKVITRATRIHAHDEEQQCRIGDLVTVRETRPRSKTKSWAVVKVMRPATVVDPGFSPAGGEQQ